MWERLSGLSGETSDLIIGDVPSGKAVVEVKSGDRAFKASGCGTWSLVEESSAPAPQASESSRNLGASLANLILWVAAVEVLAKDMSTFDEIADRANEISAELLNQGAGQDAHTMILVGLEYARRRIHEGTK